MKSWPGSPTGHDGWHRAKLTTRQLRGCSLEQDLSSGASLRSSCHFLFQNPRNIAMVTPSCWNQATSSKNPPGILSKASFWQDNPRWLLLERSANRAPAFISARTLPLHPGNVLLFLPILARFLPVWARQPRVLDVKISHSSFSLLVPASKQEPGCLGRHRACLCASKEDLKSCGTAKRVIQISSQRFL